MTRLLEKSCPLLLTSTVTSVGSCPGDTHRAVVDDSTDERANIPPNLHIDLSDHMKPDPVSVTSVESLADPIEGVTPVTRSGS
jgi:hypothetical protein